MCASEDHGKTFKDVTHLINHTFIQTEFGIAISPDHSGKVSLGKVNIKKCFYKKHIYLLYLVFALIQVILTGDVSEIGDFRLFRSLDFGLTFESTNLPFVPLIQLLFNPADCNTLLTLSISVEFQCLPPGLMLNQTVLSYASLPRFS